MYDDNHLATRLRAASVGREDAAFAHVHGGGTVSYGGLWRAAETVAGVLIAAGVAPGDRVAAQVEKSVEAIELYLGTILAGGVFLPLNTGYTPAEIDYFLGDAAPAVFVCDPARRDALTPVAERAGVCRVFTLGADGRGSLAEALADAAPFGGAVARGRDDLGAILYTSGTTGRSKGAMLSHGNLRSNSETLTEVWRFTAGDVLIHALPIFHTHGLFVATNVALMAGATLIFHAKFDAEAVLADMAGATALMGVPTFYTRLLECASLSPEALAKMRLFVSGSAPLLAETHDRWRARTGTAILERYGMTETNMNTSNPYDGERRAGTVGFPLPGVEVAITDPATGDPLPQGEVGMIEVRGPNVFKGYWRLPEKTAEELRETGFFITGDLGVIDARGYLSIVGRSKDLIITGGYNVYPKEVEAVIDEIPGVVESAVIGLPHPDFGEGVAAVVVRDDAGLTEAQVTAALRDQLARFKQPRRVIFVSALPRNTMGKVQKKALRETYADSFAAGPVTG
jgi:malonyl-CoA/methylmalonyl-CoA synthetase